MKKASTLLAVLCMATGLANAQNLLLNGDLNAPTDTGPNPISFPDSWTDWTWPDWNNSWVNRQNDSSSFDTTPYMAVGNGNGTDYAQGLYQIVGASPGLSYTLTVESGAQA